jgi:hypothetical protein
MEKVSMKFLSFLALIVAGICLILALLARFFFDGRIIFSLYYLYQSTGIFLLASIAFALQHLIQTKSK